MSNELDIILDQRREKFAQGVASGLSQAEAYRQANPRSLKWKPKTVHQYASRLVAESNVSARIAHLRRELAQLQLWSREDSIRRLADIANAYEKQSDAVAAIKELNAMHGYNAPQKVDLSNPDGTLAPRAIFINAVKVEK